MALGLAIAVVPVRQHLSRSVVLAIFAALVVSATLVGGRGAGASTSIVAGLSIDTFLTMPYGLVRLDRAGFWIVTLSLVAIAVAIDLRMRRLDRRRRAQLRLEEGR